LSCDGAVADPQGRANCGGILINSVGNFIVAFSAYIGPCSVLHSEIWGITHGLQIAKTRGIMCVRVESDSAMVINLIKDGYNQMNFLYFNVNELC
jgi:ribonuclease HI